MVPLPSGGGGGGGDLILYRARKKLLSASFKNYAYTDSQFLFFVVITIILSCNLPLFISVIFSAKKKE